MSSIPQDQNSQEWLEWRKSRIGASDIPIILGMSKFCSPRLLWKRKLGFAPEQPDNPAMRAGREHEPIIRSRVNEKLEIYLVPQVVCHPDNPMYAASLDGWCEISGTLAEIKKPCLADHKLAENSEVPAQYYPQLQWQMYCKGVDRAIYVSSYNDTDVIFAVERDQDFIDESIIPAVEAFVEMLSSFTEPEATNKDFEIVDDPLFDEYSREWKSAKELADFYSNKEKFYKSHLVTIADGSHVHGNGIRVQPIVRIGSVDYAKAWSDACELFPELQDIDLERYRKEESSYWKIALDKKAENVDK